MPVSLRSGRGTGRPWGHDRVGGRDAAGRDALNQDGVARREGTSKSSAFVQAAAVSLPPWPRSRARLESSAVPQPTSLVGHALFVLFVIALDLASVGAAFTLPALLRYAPGALFGAAASQSGSITLALAVLLWVAFLSAREAYAPAVLVSVGDQALRIASVAIPAWVLTHLIGFVTKTAIPFESRLAAGLSLPAVFLALWATRLGLVRPLASRVYPRLSRGSVLVIGDSERTQALADEIHDRDARARDVVTIPLSGTAVADLTSCIAANGVGEVIIEPSGSGLDSVLDLAFAALDERAEVRVLSSRFRLLGASSSEDPDMPVLRFRRADLTGPEGVLRRAIDLVGASVGLVLLAPLLFAIAVAVRCSSPGPALFRQERVGHRGRRFTMLKFRTMTDGNDPAMHREYLRSYIREGAPALVAEDGTRIYKLAQDPRVTPIGRWLRALSLDELPQLWNVVRGEMSLVGPRPCLPYEWDLYRPWQRRRLDVKPGCTGLWQVTARSRVSFEDMVILDLHYAHHGSVASDLWLIAQTVPAMLRGRGGY